MGGENSGCTFRYTAEELEKKFQEFLVYCKDHKVPLTLGRFCVILDCDREYITDRLKIQKEMTDQVLRYMRYILADKEERLNAGRGSVAGTIFDLKNNHGWADKQEVEHKGEMPVNVLFKKGPEVNREIDITPKPEQIEEGRGEEIIEANDNGNKND